MFTYTTHTRTKSMGNKECFIMDSKEELSQNHVCYRKSKGHSFVEKGGSLWWATIFLDSEIALIVTPSSQAQDLPTHPLASVLNMSKATQYGEVKNYQTFHFMDQLNIVLSIFFK